MKQIIYIPLSQDEFLRDTSRLAEQAVAGEVLLFQAFEQASMHGSAFYYYGH